MDLLDLAGPRGLGHKYFLCRRKENFATPARAVALRLSMRVVKESAPHKILPSQNFC